MESYQSGFLISAEGHILTAFSHVLDSDTITVTFDDGRKFEATLVGADPRLEIAVLKIEATDLPYFDLESRRPRLRSELACSRSAIYSAWPPATSRLASCTAPSPPSRSLAARRGAYETPYQGPVYVLDAMTNNPGAAGGALTNMTAANCSACSASSSAARAIILG